ncbi:hypothetical protein B0H19DRAFT_861738, partial [Mycena capillaripes]
QEGIVVWLFEPRLNSKVRHWSGTNEYPPWHNNKLGSTLNAFAHYAYLLSQESTVLADIQSIATAIKADGEDIEVLFDMMAHTGWVYYFPACFNHNLTSWIFSSSSGVGDHGKSGIETFLQKHKCGNRC